MKISGRTLPSLGVCLAAGILSGCSGAMSDVVIPIALGNPPGIDSGQAASAVVEVVDLRRESTLRRTTIGGISLGAIILAPPESELVETIVANALRTFVAGQPGTGDLPKLYCGIKTFDVVTPATALYWDVTARIHLVLRARGKDRPVSGEAVERTWVYPSQEIIGRVTTEALRQVAAATGKELPTLLALAP